MSVFVPGGDIQAGCCNAILNKASSDEDEYSVARKSGQFIDRQKALGNWRIVVCNCAYQEAQGDT